MLVVLVRVLRCNLVPVLGMIKFACLLCYDEPYNPNPRPPPATHQHPTMASASASASAIVIDVAVLENFTPHMWIALCMLCPLAAQLVTGGRGLKRKFTDPEQALVAVFGNHASIARAMGSDIMRLAESKRETDMMVSERVTKERKDAAAKRDYMRMLIAKFPRLVTVNKLDDWWQNSRSQLVSLIADPKKYQVNLTFQHPTTPHSRVLRWNHARQMFGTRYSPHITMACLEDAATMDAFLWFCMADRRSLVVHNFFEKCGRDVLKIILSMLIKRPAKRSTPAAPTAHTTAAPLTTAPTVTVTTTPSIIDDPWSILTRVDV